MSDIRILTHQELTDNKKQLINLFNKHIQKYPPCVDDANHWFEYCLHGFFQCWGFFSDKLDGVFLSVIDSNTVNTFGLSGKNILHLVPFVQSLLYDFAKQSGVRYIQTLSSPELARAIYRKFDQRPLVLITLDTWEKIS